MSEKGGLNERGNHQREFSQGVGGWAEYTVHMTDTGDTIRHDVKLPPRKVIPIIFLPGVMGSNLRMTKKRQHEVKRDDNRAWRPDDMVDKSGKAAVVTGFGLGGWFKNATPAQRQMVFDPNETEVEYYHYTSNNDRFDPEGPETLSSDKRHNNVPDDLDAIPPLLGRPFNSAAKNAAKATRTTATPAQIARWRGWSEILFDGAYGHMLKKAEDYLNNIMVTTNVAQRWHHLCRDPSKFGAQAGSPPITTDDLRKISKCWYPVHAIGYNFLRSNGESAKVVAERIRGLVSGYKKRGFQCEGVVIITHSMGGLVGRALIHPRYGNMLDDKEVKILGIYHNVMPTVGAASAYKRMRFGFREQWGPIAGLEAKILAVDGEHATAILANTPAPLELLPGRAYGHDWLKVIDTAGKVLLSWPQQDQDVLSSIYIQPDRHWWRLINSKWVNPAGLTDKEGGGLQRVYQRIADAVKFLNSIESTFHPTQSFVSYCCSPEFPSYGEIIFQAAHLWQPFGSDSSAQRLPSPDKWELLADDGKGTLKVKAGHETLVLYLQKGNSPGDATVPAERSASHVKGKSFVHGLNGMTGYEHQASYANPEVMDSLLYSIVQIVKSAKWD